MTSDTTWRRFTVATAVAAATALAIGLALSYGSAYRAAYNAGYAGVWWHVNGTDVRPAHLFPLTLDVPALVGYAGMLVLTGRRAVRLARGLLLACGGAAIALQVVDGAGLVTDYPAVRAVIHGWPPLLGLMTAHLFMKIIQALGYLQPPVAELEQKAWPDKAWEWLMARADDVRAWRQIKKTGAQGKTRQRKPRPAAAGHDTTTGARPDTTPDTTPDTAPATTGDTGSDMAPDAGPVDDAELVRRHGVKGGRQLAAYLRGETSQRDAAKRAGVSERTVSRWAKEARPTTTQDETARDGDEEPERASG